MFTGLIEAIGEIVAARPHGDGAVLTVRAPQLLADVQKGDSIAVNGVCLTVTDFDSEHFSADVMRQTLNVSTLGALQPGSRVNLERAAQVNSRLGGHIVQGHVDAITTVSQVIPGAQWQVVRFALPAAIAPLLVDKGAVTINGVSLTVSNISVPGTEPAWFEVSLIPETLSATTLGAISVGDRVNIETDIIARHVARMMQFMANSAKTEGVSE